MDWFTVDKSGLAKLLEKKGKSFAIFELIQNAWDTNATKVSIKLEPVPSRPYATILVEDNDPEGFKNLSHAFTLFAESDKKSDPSKRGRFNLGEKLVLALCEKAEIITTKGSVYFTSEGRTEGRKKLNAGSLFYGMMRMTREEYAEVEAAVRTLLPPDNIQTVFNGQPLPPKKALKTFEVTLPTEISDAEGYLKKTARKTLVSVYEAEAGETAMIYEMGIPIVQTGDKWHISVHQKVPLNVDRDNVTPAYLREVRTLVLNAMFENVLGQDATAPWVREAVANESVDPKAVEAVITQRFGAKRVIYDPTDPEGTKIAVSQGYTVIPGGALSAGEWKSVKASGAALPAGQVTPSPKPFSEEGKELKTIPKSEWTYGMKNIVEFAEVLGERVLRKPIEVTLGNDPHWPFAATYGKQHLIFNVGRLGCQWFDRSCSDPEVLALLAHEFAHEYGVDHLSKDFHDGICRVAAAMTIAAFADPHLFRNNKR